MPVSDTKRVSQALSQLQPTNHCTAAQRSDFSHGPATTGTGRDQALMGAQGPATALPHPVAARSVPGSPPGPPARRHLSPCYITATHRRAPKGRQRPGEEAQKGPRSYRNQAFWDVLHRVCLPGTAGRVPSGWMVYLLHIHRDATGEGAKQLKGDADVLVQHRERRGHYRECQPANYAFYPLKMLISNLRRDEAVFSLRERP